MMWTMRVKGTVHYWTQHILTSYILGFCCTTDNSMFLYIIIYGARGIIFYCMLVNVTMTWKLAEIWRARAF